MDPILIYGFPAGSSMGLVAAFEQMALPYRLCRVDMLHDMKNNRYSRINGRQETPVLITDDGHTLTETMAIIRWIERQDVHRRITFDPKSSEADRMYQFAAFVNTGFTAAFSPLWTAYEIQDGDPAYVSSLRKYGRRIVAERHQRLEAMLPESGLCIGDRLTLADTTLIGVARWAEFHDAAEAGDYPKLSALRRRIEAQPAVQFAMAIEAGKSPDGCGAFLGHVPLDEVIDRFGS
ncbi:glutathione S-transferase family protein [Pseudaminobacter sp. 19-2017]|uniref:Glutathione S-transferase family protein n=1 Tax=Pseudaminobacter soli (ex Zhang et al. 2022) TaxID=2831468 RepID=A0A942DZU4_9HYPH|nr:glutathione S-transferase family protein [Pseudaminobacter soli]MBS3648175.1 glutathione S-transferase family protein [Pseudaminobacter soli]